MRKLLFILFCPSLVHAAFPIISYVQLSTGATQSGGFNTTTGTVTTVLKVSSQVFIASTANSLGAPQIADCTQIGAGSTSCFNQDVGTGSVVGKFVELTGTVLNNNSSYGVFAENNMTTNQPGITYGGYFYAANGNYFNEGLNVSAGEAGGPNAVNVGVFDTVIGKTGGNVSQGLNITVTGAGEGIGEFIVANTTGSSIGLSITASTDSIKILGGDINTNNSAGTTNQALTSRGPGASPTWISLGGTGGVNSAGYILGTVVQSTQSTTTTDTTSSGTSYTVTTSSVTIIPKSTTNKIRILVTGSLGNTNGPTNNSIASIFRNSIDLSSNGRGMVAVQQVTMIVPCTMIYLDSPATTSATTYTVKIQSTDVAASATWNSHDGMATILAEEIAY